MKQQSRRSTILSRVTAVVVGVLLVAFFYFSTTSREVISQQVQTIKEGPYPVSVAAGRVETGLVSLRTLTAYPEGLVAGATAESLSRDFADVNDDMLSRIDLIASRMPDDPDAQMLLARYHRLMNYQTHLIDLMEEQPIDSAAVSRLVKSRINPQIQLLLDTDTAILEESTAAVDDVYATVDNAIHTNILISYLFMGAVIVAIVLYLVVLNRRSRRETELRDRLEVAVADAQAANEAKSAFLANMSHDIRTPLNAILGLTAITRDHVDEPARVEECLNRIVISSEQLLGLINDVLDMSKIESGTIELTETPFHLPDLLKNLRTIIEPQAADKHQHLTLAAPGITHEYLVGDTMRINQIMLNLISNAIKYTPEGGHVSAIVEEVPLTELYAERNQMEAEEGQALSAAPASRWFDKRNFTALRITVTDDGIGMSPEFLERIFDAFERERNETTNFTQGTGLGMAITKKVVDIMGGSILVESAPDEGSTFRVVLPLQVAEDQLGAKPTERDAAERELTGRVLLVEDNEINCEIATELIGALGPTVEVAHDGVEAVERVKDVPAGYYKLVFMDWQMPRMNGIDATHAILTWEKETATPHTPIVAMTANAFNDDRNRALAAGMDGFLTKPINLKELRKVLQDYLA